MTQVEIRISGHLDKKWADWLDGFTVTHTENEETILAGTVADQAAFYGIMAKLRDLGVKLISANFSDTESET
jgi:hypothetical protein